MSQKYAVTRELIWPPTKAAHLIWIALQGYSRLTVLRVGLGITHLRDRYAIPLFPDDNAWVSAIFICAHGIR